MELAEDRPVDARSDSPSASDRPENPRLCDDSPKSESDVSRIGEDAAAPALPDSSLPEVTTRLFAANADSPLSPTSACRIPHASSPIGNATEEIYLTDRDKPADPSPSRKRPAADFLPISAEIKRIGLEISDEQAQQLKNDVRRLSPILVSLRERTLGEISLTSDSGLFEEDAQRSATPERSASPADFPQPISAPIEPRPVLPTVGTSPSPADFPHPISAPIEPRPVLPTVGTSASPADLPRPISAPIEPRPVLPTVGTSPSPADLPQPISAPIEPRPVVPTVGTTADAEVSESPITVPIGMESAAADRASEAPIDPDSPGSASELPVEEIGNFSIPISGPVQRELVIVLSRVDGDADSKKSVANREREQRTESDPAGPGRSAADAGPERPAPIGDKSAEIGKENSLPVGDFCLSPKYLGNDQLSRKSPMVVIERTLQSGSRSVTETDRADPPRSNLDRVRRTLAQSMIDNEDDSPIEPLPIGEDSLGSVSTNGLPGATSDLHESPDTETETETVSDSSELTSMNSINLADCAEPANGLSCPDTDSLPSEETPEGIITRLEPERPEAFTEDSAESLALATGARDEVRSDGSDSGLGSEIPGDTGPAPAPESDSETSFLDRIPDDILTDKDKAVNQAEAFVPDAGTSGTQQTQQQEQREQQQQQQQPVHLPSLPSPPKSSLKRRLTDCMEGEPSPKRINTEDPSRKKRNIQFDAVTVYYFPRAQGFTCVPSQGGSTLGMGATHTHAERFSLAEHATEQRRIHRARLAQLRSERAANCVTEAASSSEDPSDDTDEEPSDTEELDIDSYYFLQPVPTWQRRALLRAAGVRRIDAVEKDDCRDIRASREHCGCGCKGYCDPESCPCSRANVKCQVDRAGFPCGCSRDGCANSSGRIEFNPVRVRTHFIHTLMRLQLEKKQRDEERTDHELASQSARGPSLLANPLSLDASALAGDPCINAGGFTTLHYDSHDAASTSCQPVVHAREDSLDLYAIRDDCYPAEPEPVGPENQRKLHPEFGQAFQAFPLQQQQQQSGVGFVQGNYPDYQSYQTLASTSRFQPQFQPMSASAANGAFSHYSYGQDPSAMQAPCQPHPGTHHVYENFQQEETSGTQQYTNLNSVQPMNAVVQQMGKLEPFSELLAGRYSYYGDVEPQPISYQQHAGKIEPEKSESVENVEGANDDCDENFGEIIKKSMVETVSA